MASFVDAVRTVFTSKYAIFKMVVLSLLFAYPFYQISMVKFTGWTSPWAITTILALIFCMGYLTSVANNFINEKYILLPSFINPFKTFLVGLGSVVAMGPIITVMVYVGYCLNVIFANKAFPIAVSVTGIVMVELVLFGIFAAQMTLYASNFNPFKAYHLIQVFKLFPDFALKTIGLTFGLVFFSLIFLTPLGFLAQMMFGYDIVFFCIMVFFAVILSTLIFQYFSQCYVEIMVVSRSVDYNSEIASVKDADLLDHNQF
ncbi:MAG: hypothetical protein ACI37Z_00415 [Candidatus Gastranaerophilaceae bacterium]